MSDRWQYEIIEVKTKAWGGFDLGKMREEFDRMGRMGWELVNFSMASPVTPAFAVFKKRGN